MSLSGTQPKKEPLGGQGVLEKAFFFFMQLFIHP
jgi:hypothetical protein